MIVLNRKSMFALAALCTVASAALTPTSASAWGLHGAFYGGWGHGYGWGWGHRYWGWPRYGYYPVYPVGGVGPAPAPYPVYPVGPAPYPVYPVGGVGPAPAPVAPASD